MSRIARHLLEADEDDDAFDIRAMITQPSWLERAVTKYGMETRENSDYFCGTIPCKPLNKIWHRKTYVVDGVYIHGHTMAFHEGESNSSRSAQGIWIYMHPVVTDTRWKHATGKVGRVDYKIKFWSVPFDKAEVLLERVLASIQNAAQQGYDSFEKIYARVKSDMRPYRGWTTIKPRKVTADPAVPVLSGDEQHANTAQPNAGGIQVPEGDHDRGDSPGRERGH